MENSKPWEHCGGLVNSEETLTWGEGRSTSKIFVIKSYVLGCFVVVTAPTGTLRGAATMLSRSSRVPQTPGQIVLTPLITGPLKDTVALDPYRCQGWGQVPFLTFYEGAERHPTMSATRNEMDRLAETCRDQTPKSLVR